MPDPVNRKSELPEDLRVQIDLFKRKLWQIKVTEAVFAGFFGLIASFLIILIVERFIEIPTPIRILNLVIGFSLFAVFVPIWINRWVFKHRREKQLARLISDKFPRLGDRILGVLELEKQKAGADNISDELKAAAMMSVAEEAKHRDFSEALPGSSRGKWMIALASGVVLIIAGFAVLPTAGIISSVKRWLTPWGDTERFTFVKIDASEYENGLVVPLNEDFQIDIKLHEDSRKEESGRAKYAQESWSTQNFEGDRISFPFSPKTKKGQVSIKIGDAEEQIQVTPTPRPILRKSKASIQLPDYLGNTEPQIINLSGGIVQVVEGSSVTILSESDREVSSSSISNIQRLVTESELQIEGQDETFLPFSSLSLPINQTGKIIHSGPFTVAKDTFKFNLNWTDSYGLDSKRPASFRIEPTPDHEPTTYLNAPSMEFVHLIGTPFSFHISASDDLGIKSAGFAWSGKHFKPSPSLPAAGEEPIYALANGGYSEESFEEEVVSSKKIQDITTPQSLIVKSWVEDQNPNHERVYSEQSIIVHLFDEAMMNEYHLSELERHQLRITELSEKAQENLENTELLQYLLKQANEDAKSSDPQTAKTAKQKQQELSAALEDIKNKEIDQIEEIDEINKDLEQTFQQSAMDQTLNPDTLAKIKGIQNKLQEAKKAKQNADQNLKNTQNNQEDLNQQANQNSPEAQQQQQNSEEQIEQAKQQQKKAQQALNDASKKAEEAKDNEEIATFINRLNQLAKDQREVEETIANLNTQYYEKDAHLSILGEPFDSRPETQKSIINSVYELQKQIKSDAGWIYEELLDYTSRASKPKLQEVLNAMETVRINETTTVSVDAGLDKIIYCLENNHYGMSLIKSKFWAKQFDDYAKLVSEATKSPPGGGGGGGPDQQSMNDEDFNFLLRIMQMVKQQQDIREGTRAMEQLKKSIELQKNLK